MGVTRYRSGNTTITVDDGMEKWLRGLLSAAEAESLKVLEEKGASLAAEASALWYGPNGVIRETGQSGHIVTVTTFTADTVRVSIGSDDDRIAGKTGKPVPVYVHRPRATSTITQTVDRKTWYATPEIRRAGIFKDGKPYKGKGAPESSLTYRIVVENPNASDGKFLLVEYVRKPAKSLTKEIAQILGARIVAKAA